MNDVTCHYTQYKCRPYFGDGTQTSNPKALLTVPLRHLVVDKKKRTGGLYVSYDLLQLASFDRQEKINTGNPTVGERRGPGRGLGKTT